MSYTNGSTLEQTRSQTHTRNILRNVYLWMTLALALTALTAWLAASSGLTMAMASAGLLIVLPLITLVLVFVISGMVHKMHPVLAAATFVVYAFLVGLSLSGIFYIFELGSIFQAFFGSAAMFAAMSLYGLLTKRDLSGWRTFLFMGVLGLFVANLVTFFIGGLSQGPMNYIISSVGVLIFVGLTAYDTQKIKAMSEQYSDSVGEADYLRLSIQGALSLYLDFINIFVYLLRLFGRR